MLRIITHLKTVFVVAFLGALSLSVGEAYGVSCHSNCAKIAEFKYPCPTFGKPGRKCRGREPATFATCETVKASKCRLLRNMANDVLPLARPYLESEFNRDAYEREKHHDYMLRCSAAATSVLAVVGAKYGGPWVALAGGAVGVFVSERICEQSAKW